MLKKILGSITPVVLGVSLVLAGCLGEIPSEITIGDNIPTIGAPSNVKAIAYPRVIILTWDPAKDAKSYDIYRRTYRDEKVNDVESKDSQSLFLTNINFSSGNGSDLTYYDLVGFNNQLQNEWEYEYIVVANSGQSTNKRSVDDDDVVLNASATSNRVKANIPSRTDSATAALAKPANVKVTGFEAGLDYNSQATLLVSWDQEPGVSYEVRYTYKTPEGATAGITATPSASSGTAGVKYQPIAYYRMPNLTINSASRLDKIEIRAKFAEDYYLPSPSAEEPLPNPTVRTGDPVFSAQPAFTANQVGVKQVKLTWIVQPDAAVTDAYKVYKAESKNDGKTIIGDWTVVTGTSSSYYTQVNANTYTGQAVQKTDLIDAAVEVGKEYVYKLVITGKNGGRASFDGGYVYIDDAALVAPSVGNIQYALVTAPNGDAQSLEVYWQFDTAHPDVTYKLYQASDITVKNPILTISGGTSANNIANATWGAAPVATLSKANNPGNFKRIDSQNTEYAFYNVSGLTPRKNYAFKVVAEWTVNSTTTPTTVTTEKVSIVDVAPYVTYSDLTISARTQNVSSWLDWDFVTNTVLVEVRDQSGYIKDVPVLIYRQRVDAQDSNDGSQFALVQTIAAGSPLVWRDTSISGTAVNEYYKYKAVIGTFLNKDARNITSNSVKPSDSTGIFIPSGVTASVSISSRTVTFILNTNALGGVNLSGRVIYIKFAKAANGDYTINGPLQAVPGQGMQGQYYFTFNPGTTDIPNGYTIGDWQTPIYYGFDATYSESLRSAGASF